MLFWMRGDKQHGNEAVMVVSFQYMHGRQLVQIYTTIVIPLHDNSFLYKKKTGKLKVRQN